MPDKARWPGERKRLQKGHCAHPMVPSGPPTSSTWCSSVTRFCWDLVSVSFSSVLILKPSASPVWLPCEGPEVSRLPSWAMQRPGPP